MSRIYFMSDNFKNLAIINIKKYTVVTHYQSGHIITEINYS